MSLDQRLTQAVRHVADGVAVPVVDADAVRSRARTGRRRTATLVAVGAVAVVVAAGTAVVTGRDTSSPAPPAGPVSPSGIQVPSPKPSEETGKRAWETYVSTQYDLSVGHPRDWTEFPATRAWNRQFDITYSISPSHDAFLSADDGDVRVSVWNAPVDRRTREESIPYLVSWVEDYCEESGNSPCTGIAERAVPLCLEARDCHPGLLVPFKDDVQAFFSGGIYAQDAITVVAVWRGPSSPYTADYGGSQALLEAFLSTMEVWPRSTPLGERR